MRRLKILWLLAAAALLNAQQTPELQILVIGGEGSINNVKQRTAREPIVEVRDRNNRPVAGAIVLFEAPRDGASGTFLGGSSSLRVTTDAQGRAVGQGFHPNNASGNFQLAVSATFQGLTAATVIHMTNTAGAGAKVVKAGGHGKLIAIVVAAGAAAAAGGAYAATHGGSNSTPAAPTTISAGAGTVGGRP